MARKVIPYVKLYPELVEQIVNAVHEWIASTGHINYLSRGNVEFFMKEKGLSIPNHPQYFRRVLHGAIMSYRFKEKGRWMRYVPWATNWSSRSYRSYQKVPATVEGKKSKARKKVGLGIDARRARR